MLTRDYYEHEWTIFWSGGKDSTATVLKAIELRIPIREIIYVRLMYDETRSAVIPEIDEFILSSAKKLGAKVRIVKSRQTAKEISEKVYKRSKYPQKNGTPYTMMVFQRGMCPMQHNKEIKINNKYQILGICADEEERHDRLDNKCKKSLLFDLGISQARAKEICKEAGMLNPIYNVLELKRDGCWFCPNVSKKEIEIIKNNHPALYQILKTEYEKFKKISVIDDLTKYRNNWARHFTEEG